MVRRSEWYANRKLHMRFARDAGTSRASPETGYHAFCGTKSGAGTYTPWRHAEDQFQSRVQLRARHPGVDGLVPALSGGAARAEI